MGNQPSHSRHAPPRPRANSLPSSSQMIPDLYKSLPEVQQALRKSGLESSNLIVGIDYTKSNTWTGKNTFGGFSLHHISDTPNPYQQVISILGRTLSTFDDDQLLPCYGFGDSTTTDRAVFSFLPNDKPIYTFENVLQTYSQLTPHVQLAGPTTFAPLINKAIEIVSKERSYHILLIIADGQVTRSVDTPQNGFSPHEKATVEAIVRASKYPLSIIMIGVGDGPWDQMKWFDDHIPQRDFDNFQFVSFHQVMASLQGRNAAEKEAAFATHALMEIPEQYKAIQKFRLLDSRNLPRPTHPANVLKPPYVTSSQPPPAAHPTYPPQSFPSPQGGFPPAYPYPQTQQQDPLQMSYQPSNNSPQQQGGNGVTPPVMSYYNQPQGYGYPNDPRSSQSGPYPPVDPRSSQSGSYTSAYPPSYPPVDPRSSQSGPYPPIDPRSSQSGSFPPQQPPQQGYGQYGYHNPYENPPPQQYPPQQYPPQYRPPQ